MQFFAALSLFAVSALAAPWNYPETNGTLVTATVYTTQEITITSCASTVTNCPAHSTVIKTITVAAYTTVCPVAALSSLTAAAASSAPIVVVPSSTR